MNRRKTVVGAYGHEACGTSSIVEVALATGQVQLAIAHGLVDGAVQMGDCDDQPPWGSLVGQVVAVGAGSENGRFQPGDWVSCWGPAAERVIVNMSDCILAPPKMDIERAAALAAVVYGLQVLRPLQIALGETVHVYGQGLLAALLAWLAHAAGAITAATPPTDALIYTGDGTDLAAVLPLVADSGRVLWISSGGQTAVDFNFYPHCHRRSLRLISHTWSPTETAPASLIAYATHLLASDLDWVSDFGFQVSS